MYMLKRFLILIFSALLLVGPVQALPNQEAFDIVESTTDELLQSIITNRDAYRENEQQLYQEVDNILGPVIDFKRISRRVMAKYYKRATASQREEFIKVFKKSLMRVYAKGLLELNNEKVNIVPPGKNVKAKNNKQKVDVEILLSSGKKFPVSYSMFLNGSKQWKMENVVVNGINIGLTYRNQFSRLMKVKKNDIDLVIAGWTSNVDSN